MVCGVCLARFTKMNRHLPVLKAPENASPGQRPGLRHRSIVRRPEGARSPSAPSGRAIWVGTLYPGRCPGLASSVPSARQRNCGFKRSELLPALKAPETASPGQRPGLRQRSIVWRPEGAQGPSAPSGRPMWVGRHTRGVAPCWLPPRRRRDIAAAVSRGASCRQADVREGPVAEHIF